MLVELLLRLCDLLGPVHLPPASFRNATRGNYELSLSLFPFIT